MSKWARVKLRDLYEVHNGLSKSRKFFGHGHPFLTFSTVFNHFFLPENLGSSVESTPEEQLSFSIKRGDVFITRTSETAEELGMSAVALIDYPQATYNGFCKRLRPISDCRILPEYAGYVLRAPEFRTRFYGLAGSMTSRASLRNDDLLEMDIPLPELSVQRKVSKCLFDYDSAIDNARRQIALLEEAAMRLYREWFCSKSVMETSIASLGEYMNGYAFKPSDFMGEGMPILKIREMQNGVSDSTPRNNGKNIPDKYQVFPGDIVFSWSATLDVVYWSGEVALLNQHLFKVTPREEYSIPFVYGAIKSSLETFRNLAHGATMQHIQRGKLDEVKVYCPTAGELTAYNEIAVPLYEKLMQEKALIHCLTEARDRLLPKLMSGEIEV